MPNPDKLKWKWKDSARNHWTMIAWWTGDVCDQVKNALDGDQIWTAELFNEHNECVWRGGCNAQGDEPPKLRDFLWEWQQEVNQVVVDGAMDETRKRWQLSGEK